MPNGNGVPITIVEKLLDNVKDLASKMSDSSHKTEQLEDSFYNQLEKVANAISTVGTRLNTPPRHEEIIEKLVDVSKKIEENTKEQQEQNKRLGGVIKTIKIAAALFGTAILLASLLINLNEKFSTDLTNDQARIEERIDKLEKSKK